MAKSTFNYPIFQHYRRRIIVFGMNCLLDTHAFLWTLSDSAKLSKKALETIKNPKNEIFLSAVSF